MAALSRWDPFQDMLSLREAMNQLLEDSFVRTPGTLYSGMDFAPALDLSETPDAFIVEAAVPGLKAEDLSITVENNILTINGEVHQEQETKERHYHRVERRYGKFQRALTLPTTVKADAIAARLEHGVLRLSIPKAEEVKPRRITVSVGE
jgi:HSP20 family protein